MRSIRICFMTTEYPPHPGGMARSARRLVQGLAAAGHDVTVFSARPAEMPDDSLPRSDGRVALQWVMPDFQAAARAIDDQHRLRPFDLFHGFSLPAAYPCLNIAAAAQRPVVSSIRGHDGVAFNPITTEVLQRAQWITSVSSDALSRARAVADLSQRCGVIPNGVDAGAGPTWSPLDENRGVAGTAATFRIKKNIPLLIRAYARLPANVRRRLLLVGDAYDENNAWSPTTRHAVEEVIDEAGVRGEVVITGMVEHHRIPDYHRRMRVFVLSSDHEGMPNAILEAAASGLPIVSTAVDGVKDVFSDGVDALLTPPRDPAALASAMQRVLTDDGLARRLSMAAWRLASGLSVAEELRRYLALYAALLERGAARLDAECVR